LRIKDGDKEILAFGKEAGGAEFKRAAISLHNYLDAAAGGHWTAACDYVAGWVVEGLEQFAAKSEQLDGCGAMLAQFAETSPGRAPGADAKRADVASVRRRGNRAFAIYRGRGGAPLAIEMTREGDAWKVAALSGKPVG
jgi:hypothetical protein